MTLARAKRAVAHAVAVWFGCGHVPYAPGTAGTLGAIPLYLLLRPHGVGAVLAAAVAITAVGVWASSVVAAELQQKDPQIVCVDEVAGVLITLCAAPFNLAGVASAVVCFRVLDIWKPWPVSSAEKLRGGLGVMLDNVVAGLLGAALIAAARRMAGSDSRASQERPLARTAAERRASSWIGSTFSSSMRMTRAPTVCATE